MKWVKKKKTNKTILCCWYVDWHGISYFLLTFNFMCILNFSAISCCVQRIVYLLLYYYSCAFFIFFNSLIIYRCKVVFILLVSCLIYSRHIFSTFHCLHYQNTRSKVDVITANELFDPLKNIISFYKYRENQLLYIAS